MESGNRYILSRKQQRGILTEFQRGDVLDRFNADAGLIDHRTSVADKNLPEMGSIGWHAESSVFIVETDSPDNSHEQISISGGDMKTIFTA